MCPRNLMFAVIAAVLSLMVLACVTATPSAQAEQTQLPLEMSARTAAVQHAMTQLAAKANFTKQQDGFIAAN